MNFSCLSDDLLRAVQVVSCLLPKRAVNAKGKCVLLSVDVKAKSVYAVCCDGTQQVRCMVRGCSPEKSGDYLVNASRIIDLLSATPDTEFMFSVEKDALFARAAFAEHELIFQADADTYPQAPMVDLGTEDYPAFTVGRDAFLEAIDKVRLLAKPATGKDERFAVAGVSLWPQVGTDNDQVYSLVLVCTDGSGLLKTELPASTWGDGVVKERTHLNPATLFANAVMLLGKLFADAADETLTICLAANFIVISSGRNMLRVRMLEGQYPHFDEILKPKKGSLEISVPAGEFSHCARLAAVCCDPDEPVIYVEVGEGFINMKSFSTAGENKLGSFGISCAQFPIGEDGGGLKIGLWPRHLFSIQRLFAAEDMLILTMNRKAGVMLVNCERLRLQCALATADVK